MTFDELAIGNTYSFTMASPSFLGSRLERLTLTTITNTGIARKFAEIDQLYNAIFPTLQGSPVRNIETRRWYIFTAMNGTTHVLCDQWIVENTIELIETVTYTITIPNAALGKADVIKAALTGIGLVDAVIQVS